jgi:hypothetical protein
MKTRSKDNNTMAKKSKPRAILKATPTVAKSKGNILTKAKTTRKRKVSLAEKGYDFDKNNIDITQNMHSDGNEESKGANSVRDIYGKPKPFTIHDTVVAKLTEWIEITILELYEILKEERKHHKDVDEEEICPICRCELYDNIFKLKKCEIEEINAKQLEDPSEIDVVKFKDCLDHFYHKGCTEGMLAGMEYIKCAV